MKKIMLSLTSLMIFALVACNSSDKKHSHHSDGEPTTLADSLMKDIDQVHIDGMSKMAMLTKLQQQTRRVIDSLNKLPTKVSGAVSDYKNKLDTLLKELDFAEFSMDKWMPEFYSNTDTLKENITERIKYLTNERSTANKIKESILGGIQKADSLLKQKF